MNRASTEISRQLLRIYMRILICSDLTGKLKLMYVFKERFTMFPSV